MFFLGCIRDKGDTSAYLEWFLYHKSDSTSVSSASEVEVKVKSKYTSIVFDAHIKDTGIIEAQIGFSWTLSEIEKDNPEFNVLVYDLLNTMKWDTVINWSEANFAIKQIPGKNYSDYLSEMKFYIDWK